MELIVLGSSSKGNCYLLKAGSAFDNECLVIEAGISFNEVKKALKFNINTIVGCLVSHRHGDHAKYIAKFCDAGIKVHANADVIEHLPGVSKVFLKEIKPMQCFKVGNFKVFVLPMLHDVSCLGFVIEHIEMGKVFFATDTYAIRHRVAGIDYYMIESNYNDEVLNENIAKGIVPLAMRDRLMFSHMEAELTAQYLKRCSLNRTKGIFLMHLSDNNSNANLCVDKVVKATGKPTYVLHAGDEIQL